MPEMTLSDLRPSSFVREAYKPMTQDNSSFTQINEKPKSSIIEASVKVYKKQMSVKDALVKRLKYFHFAFNSCQYVTSE